MDQIWFACFVTTSKEVRLKVQGCDKRMCFVMTWIYTLTMQESRFLGFFWVEAIENSPGLP